MENSLVSSKILGTKISNNEIKVTLSNDSNLIESEISQVLQKAQIAKDNKAEIAKKQAKIVLILAQIDLNFVNISDENKKANLEFFDKNISYGYLPENKKLGYAKRDGQIIKFEFSDNRILLLRRDMVLESKRFHIREFGKFTFTEILAKFDLKLVDKLEIDTAKKEFSDAYTKELIKQATNLSGSNTVDQLHTAKDINKSNVKLYGKAISIKTGKVKVEKTNLVAKTISEPAKNSIKTIRKGKKVAPPKASKKVA